MRNVKVEILTVVNGKKREEQSLKQHHPFKWLRLIIARKVNVYQRRFQQKVDFILGFIQRGSKGYSELDLYEFDTYLAKLISSAIRDIINNGGGIIPPSYTQEEWIEYLQSLQQTFKLVASEPVLYFQLEEKQLDQIKGKLKQLIDTLPWISL